MTEPPPTTPYYTDETTPPTTPPRSTSYRSTRPPNTPRKQCPGCAENQPNQEAHMGPHGCLGDWEDYL